MEQEKKYLSTIEEVSDALAAGKVVYFDDDRHDTLKKDENGLILLENKYEKKLCVGCFLGIEDKPYILEPKPLEVKLWHLYKNGQGKEVFIYKYHEDNTKYPFMGIVRGNFTGEPYNNKGESFSGYYRYDLVKELADLSQYFEKEPNNAKND